MGNIHTPKTIYSNGLVLEFYVKNKEIFYKLSKWVDQGSVLAVIESKQLGDKKPDDVMKEAQRLFTDVVCVSQDSFPICFTINSYFG